MRSVKINCECSGSYTLAHKSKHLKTMKHIYFLETGSPKLPQTIEEKNRKMNEYMIKRRTLGEGYKMLLRADPEYVAKEDNILKKYISR